MRSGSTVARPLSAALGAGCIGFLHVAWHGRDAYQTLCENIALGRVSERVSDRISVVLCAALSFLEVRAGRPVTCAAASRSMVQGATVQYHSLAEGREVLVGSTHPVALRANATKFYLKGPLGSHWKPADCWHGAERSGKIGQAGGDHGLAGLQARLVQAAALEGLDPSTESFLNDVLDRVVQSDWSTTAPGGEGEEVSSAFFSLCLGQWQQQWPMPTNAHTMPTNAHMMPTRCLLDCVGRLLPQTDPHNNTHT